MLKPEPPVASGTPLSGLLRSAVDSVKNASSAALRGTPRFLGLLLRKFIWLLRVVRNFVAIGAVVFIAGYVGIPYLIDALDSPRDPHQNECVSPAGTAKPNQTPRPTPGVVKDIRLTNAGAFVNRCEYSDVLYELNWDREIRHPSDPPVKPDAKKLPKLVVLYIHGWKHSADHDDPDHEEFVKFIGELAKRHDGKKQLVGVYVGWNASWHLASFKVLDLLQNVTFWSKKTIADRIAESAVVTKIISAIGAMKNREHGDQFIAIGHSFGARILFAATGQIDLRDREGTSRDIRRLVSHCAGGNGCSHPAESGIRGFHVHGPG